jgi:hypothetical protein
MTEFRPPPPKPPAPSVRSPKGRHSPLPAPVGPARGSTQNQISYQCIAGRLGQITRRWANCHRFRTELYCLSGLCCGFIPVASYQDQHHRKTEVVAYTIGKQSNSRTNKFNVFFIRGGFETLI